MIDALRAVRYSLRDFWEEFVLLAALNLLWTLTVFLPAVPLLVWGDASPLPALIASLLLALPLPVVSGGLCFFTNQVARGKSVSWGTFASGLKRYWAKSLAVAAINLVVLILLASNIQFYLFLEGAWTRYVVGIWLIVALYWLLVQIFWFPMILELENEKVLLGLRNALAMVLITPGFTIALGVVVVLLIVLCVVLTVPAAVLMAALLLLLSNHATRSRLAYVRKEPYRPGEIEPGK